MERVCGGNAGSLAGFSGSFWPEYFAFSTPETGGKAMEQCNLDVIAGNPAWVRLVKKQNARNSRFWEAED